MSSCAARALLVVPPFLKYSAGPLLGPTLLQAAARKHGHVCSILDLNALLIRRDLLQQPQGQQQLEERGRFVGDHDKPKDTLSHIEQRFICQSVLPCLNVPGDNDDNGQDEDDTCDDFLLRCVRLGFLSHDEVELAATRLAQSAFGAWVQQTMRQYAHKTLLPPLVNSDDEETRSPHLIGISLLHAGQVIPAAAISMIARYLWPRARVVWGGPHVSGIGSAALESDLSKRHFAADMFVTGHAEETFVKILSHVVATSSQLSMVPSRATTTTTSDVVQGVRGSSCVPVFTNLELYDNPPVLPAQSTLGCAYGRCTFCTYPAMEPTPTKLDLCVTVDSVVEQAIRAEGTVSIKDSLVTPRRLNDISMTIKGRVKWSACTKLNTKLLDFDTLCRWHENGLTTLEVGLESLLVDTQKRVAKVHEERLYEEFLRNAAKVPDLSLVINYMTGFPWEDPTVSNQTMQEARILLHSHLGSRGKFEHNCFELERLSKMAKMPELFSIDKRSLAFYPWASVVKYEAMPKL